MNLTCLSCGKNLDVGDKIGFRDLCPHCSAYLHSCVHCRFYVKEQCIEPVAEKVRDPEGGNYCDYFQAREDGGGVEDIRDAKSEAEALWKKLRGKKK